MDEQKRREVEKKRIPPFNIIDIKLFMRLSGLEDIPRNYAVMRKMRMEVRAEHEGIGKVPETGINLRDLYILDRIGISPCTYSGDENKYRKEFE